jgi:hypothetical protein
VAGLALVAGLLAVTGCLVVGRLMLPTGGLNTAHGYALVSISDSPTLRAALGSVLYLVLIALLSLGVATAIRDTTVSRRRVVVVEAGAGRRRVVPAACDRGVGGPVSAAGDLHDWWKSEAGEVGGQERDDLPDASVPDGEDVEAAG